MIVRSVLVAVFFLSSGALASREIVLDKIIARVNGRNILKSHLEEPRMMKEGAPFTLDELLADEITLQKAEEMNALPSAADLTATFNAEKIAHGGQHMSDEGFEQTKLKQYGMNLHQYQTQLYRYLAGYNLIQGLIAQKLIIPAQEIESYYKKNPVYLNEQYHIMVADITDAKKIPKSPRWRDLGWFEIKDMDESLQQVVSKLKPGQALSKPLKRGGKLQLVLLKGFKKKQLEPLSARYYEIKSMLRDERQGPFVKDFLDDARKRAFITYP